MKWFALSVHFSALCFISLWELSLSVPFSLNINFGSKPKTSKMEDLFLLGTKWCGPGNMAQSSFDLGINSQTDECCRSHDQCKYRIHPSEVKYALRNDKTYLVSECHCDRTFKKCLKRLKNSSEKDVSKRVKDFFFHTLKIQCFSIRNGFATWKGKQGSLVGKIGQFISSKVSPQKSSGK